MHDLDLSGLTFCHTLGHDTRRYKFEVEPNNIELGLRLTDVKSMGLQSEPVTINQRKDSRERFDDGDYDVTKEELDFLVDGDSGPRWYGRAYGWEGKSWCGQRVELTAMTSPQLIDWLEQKLNEHGIEKVIPDEETVAAAWQRAVSCN